MLEQRNFALIVIGLVSLVILQMIMDVYHALPLITEVPTQMHKIIVFVFQDILTIRQMKLVAPVISHV